MKKIFSVLVLALVAMTASAISGYQLTVGTNEHGTVIFKVGGNTVTTADEGATVTVEITPDANWSTGTIKGLWYAAIAKAPRRAADIDLLKDFELTPVEGNENAYTFVMKRANVEVSVNYRKQLTHPDITIADIQAVTYNGQAQTPAVTVQDGSADMIKDTDYSVSYEDNLNAGAATATIIGTGNYSGQVVKTFTIQKADLTAVAPTARDLTYNKQAQELITAGSIEGAGNLQQCRMEYSLDNQTWDTALPKGTDAGSYTVFYRVVADANHNDVAAQFINVPIYKAALTTVLLANANLVYNQQAQSPVITGVKAGELDVPSDAYTVSDNVATVVGNYELTVTPKDDAQNYDGTAKAAYSIIAADAQTFTISDIATQTYCGQPLKPSVTVKDGSTVLTENTDYTLTYDNNLNVGTATVTAQGIGNYTGTQTKTFTIQKADIAVTAPQAKIGLIYTTQAQTLVVAGGAVGGELQYSLDNQTWSTSVPTGTDAQEYTVYYRVVADANHNDVATQSFKVTIEQATLTSVTLAETTFIYNQQEQTAQVVYVNAGTILVPAEGYDVSGNTQKNVDVYTATVTGKGNYKGSVTAQFSIVPANANLFEVILSQEVYTYDGTAKTPEVTVKDGSATLVEGTDYTLDITNNVNAGTAVVTATGMGNYTGTQTKTYTINPAALTAVTLAQTEFNYDLFKPVPQTANVAEVKAGELIVPAEQYDVEGNVKTDPGTYYVTVTGKTNFTGSVQAQFVILDQVLTADAEETESGKDVNDLNMTVSVIDRTSQTLSIDKFTEGTQSSAGDITVEIPAEINGWQVAAIADNAMAGLNNVTDIYMPDTEECIAIGNNALPSTATIHTTLALIDDYALMNTLKGNYEASKVMTTVKPENKYWTLGTGCDVVVPAGIDVYTVQTKNTAEVATEIVPEDLLAVDGERVVKANNGVLLLGEAATDYDLVAYSGRIASGTPIAKQDNKDYGQKNALEPVIEKKHYESGHYFVLKDNEFHAILAEGDEVKVPAGKAVLHLGDNEPGANAKVLKISGDVTGIVSVENGELRIENYDYIYNLSGQRVGKDYKGVVVVNGKKVKNYK